MFQKPYVLAFAAGAAASPIVAWLVRRLRYRKAAPLSLPSKTNVQRQVSIQRGFLSTSHGDIYYQARGVGPALLFFHGNPRSGDEFEEVFQLLEERFQCIALDYLGQGRSGDPTTDEPVPMSTFAKYALDIMDRLGVTNVTVIGHLTGVSPALALAKNHPERVRHLVLAHPFYWFKDVLEKSKKYKAMNRLFSPDSQGGAVMSAWWDSNMAPGGLQTDEELWVNHRKTVDRLRAAPFQWRTIQANHDYCESGEMVQAMSALNGKRVCLISVPRVVRLMTFFGMRMQEGKELVESTLKDAGASVIVHDSMGIHGKDTGSTAMFSEDAANISGWITELES